MEQSVNRIIKRWYYIPALIWLAVSVLIGIWIRLEWNSPSQSFFDVRYLIHAHSHAALLGWIYIVFAGFTLKNLIKSGTVLTIAKPMAIALHVSNLGMLIAFSLQGYAFWSILFSSIHLFATIWLAILFLIKRLDGVSDITMKFAGAAWLWLILSGFGPFALAFSGGMAGSWALFWLGSYLYLLTNGWILFMIISILTHHFPIRQQHQSLANSGFNLMYYALPGSMFSMFFVLDFPVWTYWLGWMFNVIFAAGTVLILIPIFCSISGFKSSRVLIFSGLIFLFIKTGLQLIAFWPSLIELTSNHLLKVSFLHLFLLGCITLLSIPVFYPQKASGFNLVSVSFLIILLGIISMIVFLFMMSGFPLLGIFLFLPFQLLMALSGGMIFVGIILLLCSLLKIRGGETLRI